MDDERREGRIERRPPAEQLASRIAAPRLLELHCQQDLSTVRRLSENVSEHVLERELTIHLSTALSISNSLPSPSVNFERDAASIRVCPPELCTHNLVERDLAYRRRTGLKTGQPHRVSAQCETARLFGASLPPDHSVAHLHAGECREPCAPVLQGAA